MDIKWKQIQRMGPNDRHIHESTVKEPNAIKYKKLHYVNRPFLQYASSKWECAFIDFYDVFFNHLKYKPITFLEFGVYTGESIKYFRDYFKSSDAKIVGFDHHSCEFYGHDWLAQVKGIPNADDAGDPYDGPTNNVSFFLGDQTFSKDIKECCEEHGPFDIIMDDAAHYLDLTRNTFENAWPYLKEDGYYIIEDIGVNEVVTFLNEVTVKKEGRGVIVRPMGFGPHGGSTSSVTLVLLKSKDSITGLDEVLTE